MGSIILKESDDSNYRIIQSEGHLNNKSYDAIITNGTVTVELFYAKQFINSPNSDKRKYLVCFNIITYGFGDIPSLSTYWSGESVPIDITKATTTISFNTLIIDDSVTYPNYGLRWPKEWSDLPKPQNATYTETSQLDYDDKYLKSYLIFDQHLHGFSAEQIKGRQQGVQDYIDLLLANGFRPVSEQESESYGFYSSPDKNRLMSDKVIVAVMSSVMCSYSHYLDFDAKKIGAQ
jgi:hypothetical protein